MLTMPARGESRPPRARSPRWRSLLPFAALWAIAATVAAIRAESRAAKLATAASALHAPSASGAASTSIDFAFGQASTPFARLFAPNDSATPTSARAVVVVQLQDCNGNLGIASMLSRAEISSAVPLRAVLVEGTASDTGYVRAKLPKSLRRAAIHLLQQNERDALNAMGHHATPLLMLFDARSRLRIAAPVSADPVEVVAIRRAIAHLANNDPLK